jgi:hypothetical protein
MQIINDFLYKELRSITDSTDLGVKSACILFEEQADFIAKGLALSLKKKYSKIILSISE